MNQAGITTKNTFHDPKRRLIERRENTYRIGRRTGNLQTIGRDRKGIERLDMEELLQILSETQIPFAYHHFAEGESPEPPFICYLLPGSNNFSADGKVYYKINEVHIELYNDLKDLAVEQQLEDVLDEHGIFYNKSETWIESEKLYEVLYTFYLGMQ